MNLAMAQCGLVCAGLENIFQAVLTENVWNFTNTIVEPYSLYEARSGAFGQGIVGCQDCLAQVEGAITLANCRPSCVSY